MYACYASILTHFIFFSFLSPLFSFLILFLRCGSHYYYSSNVIDDNAHPFSGRDRSHKCVSSINFNALLRIKSYVFHDVNNSLFPMSTTLQSIMHNHSREMCFNRCCFILILYIILLYHFILDALWLNILFVIKIKTWDTIYYFNFKNKNCYYHIIRKKY